MFYAVRQAEEGTDDEDEDESEAAPVASTGWETMLAGLLQAGFAITGTWPIRTERIGRTRSIGSNALASSIVLVCRPRPPGIKSLSRRDFLLALKRELPDALKKLQHGNIAPVDLAQAAIGPGMAIYSRSRQVIESDGSPMSIRTALQLINQVLDEILSEQESEYDAHTRWALTWFDQHGLEEGPFGDADVLARAKDCSLNGLVDAKLLSSHGGKVRLLRRDELPAIRQPAPNRPPYVWEVTQRLILTLEQNGEEAAAAVLRQAGGLGGLARDLAYRLYNICERRKRADEARAYNGLVVAWPHIQQLAALLPPAVP